LGQYSHCVVVGIDVIHSLYSTTDIVVDYWWSTISRTTNQFSLS